MVVVDWGKVGLKRVVVVDFPLFTRLKARKQGSGNKAENRQATSAIM